MNLKVTCDCNDKMTSKAVMAKLFLAKDDLKEELRTRLNVDNVMNQIIWGEDKDLAQWRKEEAYEANKE